MFRTFSEEVEVVGEEEEAEEIEETTNIILDKFDLKRLQSDHHVIISRTEVPHSILEEEIK